METEEGRSRIDRATERATREDATTSQGDKQQGGEQVPPVSKREVSSDGRTVTVTDEHGNLLPGSRYIPGPPIPATSDDVEDDHRDADVRRQTADAGQTTDPTPPGAASNRRRLFRQYRTRKPQKRAAEEPPDDPRLAADDDQEEVYFGAGCFWHVQQYVYI